MASDPLLRRFQRGSCLSLRTKSTWPLDLDHAGLGAGDRALDRQFLRVQSVCDKCGDYTATYGAIGGAIVTMLWFYVSSIAILIGAELNRVVEDAWRSVDA